METRQLLANGIDESLFIDKYQRLFGIVTVARYQEENKAVQLNRSAGAYKPRHCRIYAQ